MKSISHTFASSGTTEATKLIKPIFEAFLKIYYFTKFHCHINGPLKVTGCLIFNYFKQIVIAISFEPQVLRNDLLSDLFFQILFEDTSITANSLKSQIGNTSYHTEINKLFATFSNKELEDFKVRPTHRMLKGIADSLLRYKCYEVGYSETIYSDIVLYSRHFCFKSCFKRSLCSTFL